LRVRVLILYFHHHCCVFKDFDYLGLCDCSFHFIYIDIKLWPPRIEMWDSKMKPLSCVNPLCAVLNEQVNQITCFLNHIADSHIFYFTHYMTVSRHEWMGSQPHHSRCPHGNSYPTAAHGEQRMRVLRNVGNVPLHRRENNILT
jgi:hypothetical protein